MREKKEINIQIGKEIRTARERCGMTQEQLGEILSLGTCGVSLWDLSFPRRALRILLPKIPIRRFAPGSS